MYRKKEETINKGQERKKEKEKEKEKERKKRNN